MVDKNTGKELFKSVYLYYFYFGEKTQFSVGLLTDEYFRFMTELRATKTRHC